MPMVAKTKQLQKRVFRRENTVLLLFKKDSLMAQTTMRIPEVMHIH